MNDPRTRFTERVGDYRRHRPDYPGGVIEFLMARVAPEPGVLVADVGSGTGILTRQLLEAGYHVAAVEPNDAMRKVAEADLAGWAGFRSVAGGAEDTLLGASSVSLITAAQAFHWFDPVACRREWSRILKPGGWVALIWNDRDDTASEFARAYEELLLRHGTDYHEVDHTRSRVGKLGIFWGDNGVEELQFPHQQPLSREGLHGRVDSVSYVPACGEPGYEALHQGLDDLFDTHARAGMVAIQYQCHLFAGRLR